MDAIDSGLDRAVRGLFGLGLAEVQGLLTAKDFDALDRAMDAHFQAEAERLAAMRRIRDLNEQRTVEAAKTVEPTPYKHITIQGKTGNRRVGWTLTTFYVTGLSFGDGGIRDIKKVSFGPDVTKAHRFSAFAASDIAGKLARSYSDVRVVPAK